MRLVFIGNSGSGKTTLAERVALAREDAMHYTNLKDLPLPCMNDEFNVIVENQEVIRDKIVENILYTESGCYDRSVFDQYCYSNRYIGECLSRMNAEKLQGGDYFELLKRALSHLKWSRYLLKREAFAVDYYLYCEPIDEYIKANNITFEYNVEKKRWGDLLLQQIYVIMKDKMLPREKTIVVPAMGLEERVKFVLEALK